MQHDKNKTANASSPFNKIDTIINEDNDYFILARCAANQKGWRNGFYLIKVFSPVYLSMKNGLRRYAEVSL